MGWCVEQLWNGCGWLVTNHSPKRPILAITETGMVRGWCGESGFNDGRPELNHVQGPKGVDNGVLEPEGERGLIDGRGHIKEVSASAIS